MRMSSLEAKAAAVLKDFDPESDRKRCERQRVILRADGAVASAVERPFMIEFFGTPKSGKSTMKEMLKHFFRRNGWRVSTPTEGAEVVELPRDEPQYNFQTAEYALSVARERSYSTDFHVVIFDRAIFDGVMRMQYYAEKGVITEGQRDIIESYYLLPWNRGLFDLHICLVAEPEIAIRRELALALTKKHGKTMNPATLRDLLDAHRKMWDRYSPTMGDAMVWHDSSYENESETAKAILKQVLSSFERRLGAQR